MQCADWAGRGITTSSYGLGGNFNESRMVAMARAGGGNHYYGESAEDLMEPFQQELDLLTNLALWQVELCASAPDGVQVEMLNVLPATANGWRLPELAWGSEALALLRLTLPAALLPAPGGRLTVLRVSVTGQSLKGEPVVLEKTALGLPLLSEAAIGALAEDEWVLRRSAEVDAGRALLAMRAAAAAHDWAEVDRLLADAQARFAHNDWVAGILMAMTALARERSRERMMKQSMYSSSKLDARLAARDEIRMRLDVAGETPAYLRRKSMQGKRDL